LAPNDPAAQIAHAQTLFNIACSLLALPAAYWLLNGRFRLPWSRPGSGSKPPRAA
jgi:hypothetical protein